MDEVAAGTASGAVSGATMGAMVGGPIGAALGGLAGGAIGLIGGVSQKRARKAQARALREQQAAIEREQARRAEAIRQAQVRFGDLWNVQPGDRAAAARYYALYAGSAKQQAQHAGEAQMQAQLTALQAAQRQQQERLEQRGLLGSSVAQAIQQHQQAGLAGALASGHTVATQQQQAAWHDLRQRQAQVEALARQGAPMNPLLQALWTQQQLNAQKQQVVPTMLGNMLNTGLGFASQYMLTQALAPSGKPKTDV